MSTVTRNSTMHSPRENAISSEEVAASSSHRSMATIAKTIPKEAIVDYVTNSLKTNLGNVDSRFIEQALVRQVLDNTALCDLVTEAQIDSANAHLAHKFAQRKIPVKQKVTKDQERILRDRFWKVQLDFTGAIDSGSHSFHRAHRILSKLKILDELNVDKNSKPTSGYDAVYKDIGGNPTIHLNENFVHTCFPLLSNNDDKRNSNYLQILRTSKPQIKFRSIFEKHIRGDSSVICHRVGQNCNITAPYLLFIHSTYDMTPSDIAESMFRSKALIAKGCFIFNPKILYENSGSLSHDLNFTKFVRNSQIYIRFWFTNDNQEGYEHLYSTYISLIRSTRISFSNSYYNIQFEDQKLDDVVFFTIRKSISGSIPRSNVFRVFTDNSLESKCIIYYWRWETLNSGSFLNSLENNMKPVRLVIPLKLYLKLRNYADTLSDTKFTVQNLLKAAVNFNSREVISGQSVGVVEPVDPDTLKHLTFAVYMITYISNFECFRALTVLQKDEDRVRDSSSQNFFRRFCSNQFWSLRSKLLSGMTVADYSAPDFDSRDFSECKNSQHIHDTLTTVIKNEKLEVTRRFSVLVRDKLVRFITVDEELAALDIQRELYDVNVISEDPLSSLIDPISVRDTIIADLESMSSTEAKYTSSNLVHRLCNASLIVLKNESNGDCFFQSVIDQKLYTGSVTELRLRLRNSIHINSIYNSAALRRALVVVDGSENGFMPMEAFILLSLEFEIAVCVHYSGHNLNFGNGKLYHFDVRNKHCSALKHRHSFQPTPTVSFNTTLRADQNSNSERDLNFSNFFEGDRGMSNTQFKANLKVARENYYPLSELGNGGYVCRSGLKTAEMFERYFSKDIESAVSIGGPGAEVQFLVNKLCCRVFGITHTDKVDFDILSYPAFTQLYGETGTGDVIPHRNKIDFIQKIRAEFPQGVDFFGGDIADNSDFISDYDAVADLVRHEVILANGVLSDQGQAYFKIFDLVCVRSLHIMYTLEQMFESVSVVKLETSRPACTELHVICHGFRASTRATLHALLVDSQTLIPDDFIKKMNYISNYFNDLFNCGLNRMKKCFYKIGTKNQLNYKLSDDIIEGYRSVLAFDEEVTMGVAPGWRRTLNLSNIVVNAVHEFFAPRDFDRELRDLMQIDDCFDFEFEDDTLSTVYEASLEDEDSFRSVETIPEEVETSLAIEEPEIEEVVTPLSSPEISPKKKKSFVQIVKKRSNKFKKLLSKSPKSDLKEKIAAFEGYTEIDQFVPTGISSENIKTETSVRLEVTDKTSESVGIQLADHDDDETMVPVQSDSPQSCMYEFLELTRFTYESELSNHKRVWKKLLNLNPQNFIINNERGNYGLIEIHDEVFNYIVKPEIVCTNYNKCFDGESFISYSEAIKIGGRFLISDYCELCLDYEMVEQCEKLDIPSFVLPEDVSIVQAAPGCGKTHFIVHNCVLPSKPKASNILLSTREGRDDFVNRLRKRDPAASTSDLKTHVRTLASFLLNAGKNKKSETLFVDEALMSHPGQIFFAIALSGATTVKMLGDVLQIPFVNRTPAFKCKYSRLQDFVPISETLYVSYRCPPDVARRLDSHYMKENSKHGFDNGMKSAVQNLENTCTFVHINNDNFGKENHKGKKILVFTQGEKTKLKNYGLDVSTVHEYQGKEADEIIVVRLDPYKTSEIYLRFNYALVALTRHKKKLTYYTRVPTDALSTLIKVNGTTVKELYSRDEIRDSIHTTFGAWEDTSLDHFVYSKPKSYSSLQTVQTSLKTVSSHNRIYFVPKIGKHYHRAKKFYMDKPYVIVKNFYGKYDILVVSKHSAKKSHDIRMVKDNLESLSKNYFFSDGSTFFCSNEILDDLDSEVLSAALYKKCHRFSFFFCTDDFIDDAPSQIFELENMNASNDIDNQKLVTVPIYEAKFSNPKFESVLSFNPNHAQTFLNSVFSDICYVDQSFDDYDVFNSELNLELGRVQYNPLSAQNYEPEFENMQPVLKTPCPHDRKYNYREILLALEKRNRNVPYFNGVVDFERSSDQMLDNLIRECFDADRLAKCNSEEIRIGNGDIHEWLRKQPLEVYDKIVPSFALHNDALNEYNFSIKKQAKPNLTVDATSSYAALQTIVYHEKHVNAIFCTIFNEVKRRIKFSLKKHIKIFSDVSCADFEKLLNSDIPLESIPELIDKLEIDISKYDKSQRELALEFECKLMRFFKVPGYFITLWYYCHILTYVYDKNSKLKALIPYQRKSGDASTFIGNTLFLMAVIADLIPLSLMHLVLFSGDDSLIYGFGLKKYKDTQHFGLKFNLEIKFFDFMISYFCSKFLVGVNGLWTFTPDPVKLFVKIGRHNLINPAHVEEYRVSLVDNCLNYRNYAICVAIGKAVRERYGIFYDFTTLFASIPDMLTVENFHKLYQLPSGKLNPNTFSNSFDY
ncbi:ORF1 [Nelorpivirus dungfly]|nr:ORF1 [Nelorpivirus dungfly]